MPLGMTTQSTGGRGATVIADGNPEYKVGGGTLDWSTVPANGSDTTLLDGQIIKTGIKYLPFGLVLTLITASRKYGPHDPGASDGRQLLARGKCFLLSRTIAADDINADNPEGILVGGGIFTDRVKLLVTGAYASP